jgi:prepilin-type N-terminal cleavage/methylation domain-containing protein
VSGERGFTLTEMAVSLMVLMIVMTMTYVIATTLVKQVANGTSTGASAEAAQSQMVVFEQYLDGAITPTNADAETGLSSLCSASGVGANQAVQDSYDYALELCTAPFDRNSCSSSNQSSLSTSCPQLFLLYVDKTTCTTAGQCTFKIVDLATSSPSVVYSAQTFRCPATCQSDLETVSSNGAITAPNNSGNGHEGNGTAPSFPYLFTFFDSTGTHQVDGTSSAAIQSIHLDLEALNVPVSPVSSAQRYTEINDGVWLTGAATPPA